MEAALSGRMDAASERTGLRREREKEDEGIEKEREVYVGKVSKCDMKFEDSKPEWKGRKEMMEEANQCKLIVQKNILK